MNSNNIVEKDIRLCFEAPGVGFNDFVFPEKTSIEVRYDGKIFTPDTFYKELPYFGYENKNGLYHYLVTKSNNDPNFDLYGIVVNVRYIERNDFYNLSEFNTKKSIINHLSSYEKFCDLIRKRKWYYNKTKNKLNEFVIAGRLKLDAFGQTLILDPPKNYKYNGDLVVEASKFYEWMVNVYNCFAFSYGNLPDKDEFCPLCGKKFTLNEVIYNDFYKDTKDFYHKDCYAKKLQIDNYEYFNNIALKVFGEGKVTLIKTPNPDCDCFLCKNQPHFMLITAYGIFKIGRARSIISIIVPKSVTDEYTYCANFEKVFEKENVTKLVTKDGFEIHAANQTYAIEYLNTIKKTLKAAMSLENNNE